MSFPSVLGQVGLLRACEGAIRTLESREVGVDGGHVPRQRQLPLENLKNGSPAKLTE